MQDFSDLKEIYRGRHSVVWTCTCKQTCEPVILKAYVKGNMQLRHFQQVKREIALMKEIDFTGVVIFKGTFEDNSYIFIVQEDCKKGDLFKRVLRAGGILPERVVVTEIILPMLYTLDHLHKMSIIHRDIKPENIFFNASGALKLGDFGLSINMVRERPKSRVGTLDYMAPEVISLPNHEQRIALESKNGTGDTVYYGPPVDIWAVGVLAYELLVGRPPFEVEEERDTVMRIMYHTDIEFPCYVSKSAQAFILEALKKSPQQRPDAKTLAQHMWLKPYMSKFISMAPPGLVHPLPSAAPRMPIKSALSRRASMKRVGFSPDALATSVDALSVSQSPPARSPTEGNGGGGGGVHLPPISQAKDGATPRFIGKVDLKRTKTLPNADAFKNKGFLQDEKIFSGSGGTGYISAQQVPRPPTTAPPVSTADAAALASVCNNEQSKRPPMRARNKTVGADLRADRDVLQALKELDDMDDNNNPSSVAPSLPSTFGGRITNYLKSRLR